MLNKRERKRQIREKINLPFAAIGKKSDCESVCNVTDLESLFIANEIIVDGMGVGSERGESLPLSRDSTSSSVHADAAWSVLK